MKQPDEGNLFTDLMEFGPAPTMAREVVVILISLALIGIVFAIVGPSVLVFVAAAVAFVFLGIRFALGLRGWSRS
ncbi:hypothetical protein [Rhodococcoides kyotonense]|nr:hypothetical protein [Rhodococcus kyotonensis]